MSDFDPAEHAARINVLMDEAVEAAHRVLMAALDNPVAAGGVWHRLLIREWAAMFPVGATVNDDLARELNAALAARGAPYRLTKGVA